MSQERPGQTLQATALVHEAYLSLVDTEKAQHWNSRGHFFAAAAEAMRRFLVENARRKRSLKRGGGMRRTTLEDIEPIEAPAHGQDHPAHSRSFVQGNKNRSVNTVCTG
jgi:RNA polymerase sigma factor (TIGR02999 family)